MIAGRYEPLDDGLARDTELDRIVRLRWIESTTEVDDPRLSHPNVVRVFDVGEHEGRRFAAVEHVPGLPLALVGPLSADDAVALGLQACRGLAAAHELGLAHMGEILVRSDNVPKLSGFRHGEPGSDVLALAEALNDASPALPPLRSTTTDELLKELEDIRPTVAREALPHTPLRKRRSIPLPPILAAIALVALIIGLIAALHGSSRPSPAKRRVAPVQPIPHGATAQAEAANLSSWLARYSR